MDDCNLFGGRVRLKGPRTSTKAYCALECYCTKVLAKIELTVLSFFLPEYRLALLYNTIELLT